MISHEIAGKDTLPRGVVVFCRCGGSFYAPFNHFNGSGMFPPGDLEAAMREADRRWQEHSWEHLPTPTVAVRRAAMASVPRRDDDDPDHP